MYKLLVGAGLIAVIILIMATTGTYLNAHLTTDISDNIDTSTEMGNRANHTMLNRSKVFDSSADTMAAASLIIVITLPLAAIVILKKIL